MHICWDGFRASIRKITTFNTSGNLRQAALGVVEEATGDVKGGYFKSVECSENMQITNVHRQTKKEHQSVNSHGDNHAPWKESWNDVDMCLHLVVYKKLSMVR